MYNSVFQAVGKWKTSLLLAVLRLGVIFNVLAFSMDAIWGVTGLMWVQAVTDTVSFIIAAILYARFKRSIIKESKEDAAEPVTPTANRVVAISREFGSGGRTIGKAVADALGIPCYDSELIEKIAVDMSKNSASMPCQTASTTTHSRAEPTTDNPTQTSCGLHKRTSLRGSQRKAPA